jgi:hypothetical protein
MSGILNSKQRIMDVLITNNGRRQIADGTFKIDFASFSDHGVFYRDDGTGAADDAGSRIMFEAYSSNTDIVIPEINSLNSISMDTSSGRRVVNGSIVQSGTGSLFLSGAIDVYSSSIDIIQTAVDHFDQLQIIGSSNHRVINEYFSLSENNISFESVTKVERNLDTISAIWAHETTNSQPQFRYMAPVYESDNEDYPMASYAKINYEPINTYDSIKNNLAAGDSQMKTVTIQSSDQITNLIIQCFEPTSTGINKLAIVDYGSYFDDTGNLLGSVYHLGKVYRDDYNNPKFIRLMSILFE